MRDLAAAVVQLNPDADIQRSLDVAAGACQAALAADAELVVLPENYWGITSQDAKAAAAVDLAEGPTTPLIAPFAALSAAHPRALLVLGGLPERPTSDDPPAAAGLVYNTLVALQAGAIVGSYRKIHRFDATLRDGTSLRESASTAAGSRPLVLRTEAAAIGLSICYDLRFPSLYRALAAAGAEIIVAPSAFTLHTGLDHWEVLVRARALDTQSYVLAPALHGRHGPTRHSFGHSMIVDPWGTVIAQASPGDGVVHARLSASLLARVREDLPVLRHQVLPGGPAADIVDVRGAT
ncbi:MAG: carbon-nitrogen hydrolase family protein [Myxococcales bacterium]|nr:carbon-nitrogen hydrolase family protein [Myxococcales bacterium]